MTMRSRLLLTLLAGALLVLPGCGGSSSSTSAGSVAAEVAGLVPASTPILISIETDPDSDQWQQADALLGRFPGRQRLLDEVGKGLAEEGVDFRGDILPALGDETYVAVLDFEEGEVVGLTKPRDEQKLTELLRESESDAVTRQVNGWTLIADSEEVLDRFENASEKLEDADWFDAAQGRVEESALVTFYANGVAINDALTEVAPAGCDLPEAYGKLEYAAGTLVAEDDGLRVRVAAEGEGVEDLVQGESLLSQIPAGAFAYLGSPGFDTTQFSLGAQLRCALDSEDLGAGLPDVERQLGVSFDDLFELFAGGYGLYVRSGTIIPEVTLLLAPEEEARAVATMDELAEKVTALGGAKLERRQIGETDARELDLGPVTILYGAGDGKVVVSTGAAGFDSLSGEGAKLEDDAGFRDAGEAAGIGDSDDVFAYFDLSQLVELADQLAGLADQDLPPEVRSNLEPLTSFLAWGDLSDPNDVEFGAFLGIR